MMEDIKNGVIGLGGQDTDYLITGETQVPPLQKMDTTIIEYSQGGSNRCTLFGSFGALSDIFNTRLSEKEIEEIVSLAITRGFSESNGWFTQSGVKCVCDWWNAKHPDQRVLFFRINLLEKQCLEALANNYTIIATYKGNSDYNKDKSDGKLDGAYFPNSTYGHCIGLIGRENKIFVKDNYAGKPNNIYEVVQLNELVVNDVFYEAGYLIVPEKNVPNTEEELKRLTYMQNQINIAMGINSRLYDKTKDHKYQDDLHVMNESHRVKLLDIQKLLMKGGNL